MDRKTFIRTTIPGGLLLVFPNKYLNMGEPAFVMTVKGKIGTGEIGAVLPHEHIATDFTGAEKVAQPQYDQADVFKLILPWLEKIKDAGVTLVIECTPNYIGRDVRLLTLLSEKSGLNIMTNTGYYAAAGEKYLPRHAFYETAGQLAARFLGEWTDGIDGSGIRPGFIKLGVDKAPLTAVEKKIIKAAAMVHLKTGLKVAIHTGDGEAAKEEFSILTSEGIAPEAFIWVHAQNDKTGDIQVELAKKGCWISLDGINASDGAVEEYGHYLTRLKKNNLLHRVLISHDDGWAVIKNEDTGKVELTPFKNGNTVPYQTIFTRFKPYLLQRGFTEKDFAGLMIKNPVNAYTVKICRR